MSGLTVRQSGISLGGAGFLVLLVLKVMGLIELGWFWVLSSVLWLPIAVILSAMGLAVLVAFLITLITLLGIWIKEKVT